MKPINLETGNSSKARQRVVVVIGAGRSGTSSITRGVQALGVELGNDFKRGRGKNPTGFFEDKALLAINKKLRRILGIRADSVRLIDAEAWKSDRVQTLAKKTIKTIRKRFGHYPLWGYKYGRTLRLLPFWENVFNSLDLDVSYVVAIRNPLSVARSRAKLDARRGRQEHSDLEWLVSIVPYFGFLRDRRFVVVDYDQLMSDPQGQLRRMAHLLGLQITVRVEESISEYSESFLQSGMRHTQFTDEDLRTDPRVNQNVYEAYRLLYRLSCDEVDAQSSGFWEQWQTLEQRLKADAPMLQHIDTIESELRHARIHPLGPFQVLPSLYRKLRSL